MERWKRKVAIVTGCSSGIGERIARHLCQRDLIVVGLARRTERLKNLQNELNIENREFYYHECDVSDKFSVKAAFTWISQTFSNINILVNCAGVNIPTSILTENNEATLESVINTNLMGSLYCIKEAYKIMERVNGDEYYIININSVLGHSIVRTPTDAKLNVYPSSKFGLRAASEVLRLELLEDKRFHISNISPGLVKTEMGDLHPDVGKYMNTQPTLDPKDVAQTVEFILSIGRHVQIADIIIKPVGEKI